MRIQKLGRALSSLTSFAVEKRLGERRNTAYICCAKHSKAALRPSVP